MAQRQMYRFQTRRSVVHSIKGIVSSSQPLASKAGIQILERGGNAADAAVAVAAALNLTEPCSTGIGGDMFCLFYDTKSKKVHSLNGSGRSALDSSLEGVKEAIGDAGTIPTTSVHSVTIPGAAAGWVDVVSRFGSGEVGLKDVLEPAIGMAEGGYVISHLTSYFWQVSEKRIKQASPNGHEILKKDGNATDGYRAPREGEVMTNPNLAKVFKSLAQHGKDGFYKGEVAEAILKETKAQGGFLTQQDLDNHCEKGSEDTEPISLKFDALGVNERRGGVEVWEHPPNGQGIVALMALGIIQELEKAGEIKRWKSNEHNSVSYLHPLIEALRLAFADANWFIADPTISRVPTKELISPTYLSQRASLYSPTKALPDSLSHGSPAFSSSDTVYFSVTDSAGNACSFINSNYAGFGTAIVPAGCGFTLQNRGANFSLEDGHPNVYAAGKRPYHTIIPGLVTHADNGELAHVFGVMGGFMQPQGHVQVLLNMHIFGMDEQEALDAPRFCIGEGMPDASGNSGGQTVFLEEGISNEVVEELRRLGHRVEVLSGYERALFGRGQIISKREDEGRIVWSAGSDPRADGIAIPLI